MQNSFRKYVKRVSSFLHQKTIRILPHGEVPAEGKESVDVERDGRRTFVSVGYSGQPLAFGRIDHAPTLVTDAIAVYAYSVDSTNIALILQSARPK